MKSMPMRMVQAVLLSVLLAGATAQAAGSRGDADEADQSAFVKTEAASRTSTSLTRSPVVHAASGTGSKGQGRDSDTRFDLVVRNAQANQVFLQLGSGTNYNILVPPDLTGSISVSLKNTTVPEALDTLRELYGYDFRITGNRVFIYSNAVQTRMFRVNYLPGRRMGASDLRVTSSSISSAGAGNNSAGAAGAAGSSGGNAGGSQSAPGGGTGGSGGASGGRGSDTSSVRTTSDSDFWRDVHESLNAMVGTQNGRSVTLNPAAGVILVRATSAELRQVADYLRAVQVTIERQVMLEAKIVEVQLSKTTQSGINWALFRGINSGNTRVGVVGAAPNITLNTAGTMLNSDAAISAAQSSVFTEALGRGFYGLAVQAANFAALISFLETQGDVQVLSSPRIATLNNQKAVLKVGSDELFVTGVKTDTTTSSNGNTMASPTLTLQPFFSGISLDVTPQIDENGTVMLHVHPAISVVAEKQKVIDLGQQGTFKLPLATSAINETDSIVRVHDGHIVAIGGLMTQSGSLDQSGLPGLSEIPVVGGLFRQKTNTNTKHELVILIKPTILTEDGLGVPSNEPATPLIGQAN